MVPPGLPPGCSEVALRLPQGCSEVAPRLKEVTPRSTRGCPQVTLKLPRGCFEVMKIYEKVSRLDTSLIKSGLFLQTLTCLISMTRYYMGWMSAKTKVYNTKWVMVAIIATISFLYFLLIILYTITPPPACMNNLGTPSAIFKSSAVSILIVGIEIVATCLGIFADLHMIQLLKKMKKGKI